MPASDHAAKCTSAPNPSLLPRPRCPPPAAGVGSQEALLALRAAQANVGPGTPAALLPALDSPQVAVVRRAAAAVVALQVLQGQATARDVNHPATSLLLRRYAPRPPLPLSDAPPRGGPVGFPSGPSRLLLPTPLSHWPACARRFCHHPETHALLGTLQCVLQDGAAALDHFHQEPGEAPQANRGAPARGGWGAALRDDSRVCMALWRPMRHNARG